jgi:ethanolamine utilization protein EutN
MSTWQTLKRKPETDKSDVRAPVFWLTVHDLRTMQLARVIGTVVATMKNPSLEGRKLLIIQSLNKNLAPQGKPLVAIDAAGAGVGELVFWCRGKEASFPFKREDTPTDCTIVGIVDSEKHVTSS